MVYAIIRKSNKEVLGICLNPIEISYKKLSNRQNVNFFGINKNEVDIIKMTNDPGWTIESDYLVYNENSIGYKQEALDWVMNEINAGNYDVFVEESDGSVL